MTMGGRGGRELGHGPGREHPQTPAGLRPRERVAGQTPAASCRVLGEITSGIRERETRCLHRNTWTHRGFTQSGRRGVQGSATASTSDSEGWRLGRGGTGWKRGGWTRRRPQSCGRTSVAGAPKPWITGTTADLSHRSLLPGHGNGGRRPGIVPRWAVLLTPGACTWT